MSAIRALTRVARRSIRQNELRSALVIGLIALLVGAGTAAGAVIRTVMPSDDNQVAARFGEADVVIAFDTRTLSSNLALRAAKVLPDLLNVDPDLVGTQSAVTPPSQSGSTTETGEAEGELVRKFTAAERNALSDEIAELFEAEVVQSRVAYPFQFGFGGVGTVSDLDLTHPIARSVFDVERGRLPKSEDEIAATPTIVGKTSLGSKVTVGGKIFTLVGLIADPSNRRTNAALVSPAGFDRAVSEEGDLTYVYRVATQAGGVSELLPERRMEVLAAMADRTNVEVLTRADYVASDIADTSSPIQTSTLLTGLFGLQIALVAMSAFTVGVRRRTVEFGQLVTTGADRAQIRTLVLIEAALLGLTGAVAGAAVGIGAAWWAAQRGLLLNLGDRFAPAIRWNPVDWLGPVSVGIAASVVAAWWPARSSSRLPVVSALNAHVPVAAPRRIMSVWAVLGVSAGIAALAVSARMFENSVDRRTELIAAAVACLGVALMVGGTLALIGHLLVRFAKSADRLPLIARLAVRNSSRQRSRSWAAIAGFVAVLAAPVVVAAAFEAHPRAVPNERQVVVDSDSFRQVTPGQRLVLTPRVGEQLADGAAEFERLTATTSDEVARFAPVSGHAAILRPVGLVIFEGHRVAGGLPGEFTWLDVAVATPELLSALDLGSSRDLGLNEDTVVWVGQGAAPKLSLVHSITSSSDSGDTTPLDVRDRHGTSTSRLGPSVLVSPEFAQRYASGVFTSGQLVVAERRISEIEAGRIHRGLFLAGVAGPATYDIGRDLDRRLDQTQISAAVLAGSLLLAALVTLMTAALAAVEVDQEIGSMIASGASPSLRRQLLGVQSAYHLAIAAALGTPLALAMYWTLDRSGRFEVPWTTIAIVGFVIPLAVGMLTATLFRSGRPAVSRRLS